MRPPRATARSENVGPNGASPHLRGEIRRLPSAHARSGLYPRLIPGVMAAVQEGPGTAGSERRGAIDATVSAWTVLVSSFLRDVALARYDTCSMLYYYRCHRAMSEHCTDRMLNDQETERAPAAGE